MTDRAALIALRDAVVAGDFDPARFKGGPVIWRFNAFMDKAEPAFEGSSQQNTAFAWDAYKGSVDAAITLLEAVLPGCKWFVVSTGENGEGPPQAAVVPGGVNLEHHALQPIESHSPARALLIATLNALIAKEPTDV